MARILIVDDEPSILNVLFTLLKSHDYEPVSARGGEQALSLLDGEYFDLMISDIRMSPIDGLELLRRTRKERPQMPVIMLTAFGSVETAVTAMKDGAYDYVTKPFKVDELLITVQRALEFSAVMAENKQLKAELQSRYKFENIVAESKSMRKVCDMIQKVAPTDGTVLILGESGTGKELVAKAIHANSARSGKKFLPINCAALPEPLLESEMFGHVKGAFTGAVTNKLGLFEAAEGGTIFLDEIGSMPLSIQAKLLRVLQDRQVRKVGGTDNVPINVRVLAATNDRLENMIKAGTFREDLFYRLSVIPIEIPPLRTRPEDVMPLIQYLMRKELGAGEQLPDIESEAQIALEQYEWKGNVRELENAVRHALTFNTTGRITLEELPARIAKFKPSASGNTVSFDQDLDGKSLKAYLRAKEIEYIKHVLDAAGNDKDKAASILKVSLATLYRKLPEPID